VEAEFRNIYDTYFNILKENIPGKQQGNFYNTVIDVLQNHMTAHLEMYCREKGSSSDAGEIGYVDIIKTIIRKNFFYLLDDAGVHRLDSVIAEFYALLDRYLLELLEKETPGVLGISVYKGTFAASLFAFKRTREKYPHIKTVMGGGIFADQLAKGSPNFQYFLDRTPYIDKIIVGEGEQLFLKLLRGELPGTQRVYTLQDIKGEHLDLTSALLPDFSDFDIAHYPQLAAYTSRSCPFQCGFCAETVNWGKYRRKKAPHVVKELTRLYNTHGCQLYLMTDSLLNPIVTDLAGELIDSDTAIYWDGYLRADNLACDEENVFLWRRGGFYRARLGIESGSPRILQAMDKHITPHQIRTAVSNLARAGIKTSTYWVIGYPGETEADFQASLDIIEELKDDIYEAECNPFRFYLTAQVQSGAWLEAHKPVPLYPGKTQELLILQTWILEKAGTSREELYSRLNRFVEHCNRLGIPNPYSWPDIYEADERWRKLHPNAVPPLVTFRDADVYIDECKRVERVLMARNIPQEEGDFDF
jgi:radical SAM superfamily enzyme YgiQ (UPF0313 family)